MYQKYHKKGLVIIGVNKDFKEDKCRNWQKRFNLPWYTVYDGENKISELYMVKQLPQNIVIDKTGKIIAKNLLMWEIEDLLKEKLED
jgi:peroxiredoxin